MSTPPPRRTSRAPGLVSFRDREEVERSVLEAGYVVDDVRDAPDRSGGELVFSVRAT
ncbi:MAG: hypothetical protein ACR2HP_02355 [Ilumatobacteraceae bacterium]